MVLVEWGDVVEATFGEHLVVRLELVDGDEEARDDHVGGTGHVGRGAGAPCDRRATGRGGREPPC